MGKALRALASMGCVIAACGVWGCGSSEVEVATEEQRDVESRMSQLTPEQRKAAEALGVMTQQQGAPEVPPERPATE